LRAGLANSPPIILNPPTVALSLSPAVILSPALVILSEAKDLGCRLRVDSAKDLKFGLSVNTLNQWSPKNKPYPKGRPLYPASL